MITAAQMRAARALLGIDQRQLAELSQRSVQILYVLSGNDPGLDEIAGNDRHPHHGQRIAHAVNLDQLPEVDRVTGAGSPRKTHQVPG